MKKRNWLMTIAFAVLSLTIISTCVIGSTYAKFVSKVSGSGSAQAAGFLITGGSTTTTETVVLAPTQSTDVAVNVNYFSQVVTDIEATLDTTDAENGNSGAFAAANWEKIIAFYEANTAKIITALGSNLTAEEAKIADSFKTGEDANKKVDISKVISIKAGEETDMAKAFVDAVVAEDASLAVTGNDKQLKAMSATAKTPVEVALTVSVTWNSVNDVFDTYIGNIIAAMQQGIELSFGDAKLIVAADPTGNQLAKTAAGTLSTVGLSLGLTATQHIDGTTGS